MSVVSIASASAPGCCVLPARTLPCPRPTYFGPADRPLFGIVHRPPSPWTGARILLCAPLGYEGLFSYLTLNDLAVRLAEATSAVVMRFDYDGAGDSAGADDDDDRIRRALASIDHAIEHLKGLSDAPGRLLIVGLRAGALLAACAAAKRDDVSAIALWAPCASGKAFVREQKVFSQMTESSPPAPPGLGRSWGERGFEANGHVFTDAMVRALEALSFAGLETPPAPDILLLHRADMPALRIPPGWSRAAVEELSVPGYSEMMEPPWLWKSPDQAMQMLCDWARRIVVSGEVSLPSNCDRGQEHAVVAHGIVERPVRFGAGGGRFGILTRPDQGPSSGAVVLVTSTYGYRVGPNRINVELARRLAAAGISTLRLDVRGVGDSRDEPGSPPGSPYQTDAIDDVVQAVRYLEAEGYRRIALHGVCAGAFLAWQAALVLDGSIGLVLANLETFVPIPYDRENHLAFIAGAPRRESPRTAADKARRIFERLPRLVDKVTTIVLAHLPSTFRPDGLPAQLVRLGRRGSKVILVFGDDDPGLHQYLLRTGLRHFGLWRSGVVKIVTIAGADHSFTPRWAVERLSSVVTGELEAWFASPESASR